MQTDPVGYSAGINWYLYCRNNPLNWLDPSGLLAIAFYDGGDPGSFPYAGGSDFKEMADDFTYYYDIRDANALGMTYTEYITWALENWLPTDPCDPCDVITDVYIYDHASVSLPQEVTSCSASL